LSNIYFNYCIIKEEEEEEEEEGQPRIIAGANWLDAV
jgi:hypothetical protein